MVKLIYFLSLLPLSLLSQEVNEASPTDSKLEAQEQEPALQLPRKADGDLSISVEGQLKQWHKVTLTLNGPFAHELDHNPNPFTDSLFEAAFTHETGKTLTIPGYFAADGQASESSAQSGTIWRVHFSPPLSGSWTYQATFTKASRLITGKTDNLETIILKNPSGSFTIAESDKTLPDFRARGRLAYVGKHLLQFQGDQSYFLKAGADAPETLLAFADFDGTAALNAKKAPLKTWSAHIQDWQEGDPSWQGGKGKGLIGALNYLSGKGGNAFSFLPYNVDGDGNNVWPFSAPREKLHYDCSKLDQWGIVFEHATSKGLFLHFKMQETENDDNRGNKKGRSKKVLAALDGGKLGIERKLYCRELVARFGHNLALNWNIGEENTQSTEEQLAMANYIRSMDPYDHHIVIHSYPKQQNKVYNALLGKEPFTGTSLQNNSLTDCHQQVLKWLNKSKESGRPWVIAFDEPGNAQFGMPADPGYPGMPAEGKFQTIDECRKYTLWGTLMAGGMGVEYYFGYKLPQNDLLCEDWRSRDLSWDYCRHALSFFASQSLPLAEMTNRNELIGNDNNSNSKYCLAKEGEVYLVYLPTGGQTDLQLTEGSYSISWYNPRNGEMSNSQPCQLPLQAPDSEDSDSEDWLALVRKD